jgi:hypothetical protein
MYGGHPDRSRFTSACRAGQWGPPHSPSRFAAVVDPRARFLSRANQSQRLNSATTRANTARPTAQSVARVVWARCRNAHRSPHRRSPRCEGLTSPQTPASSSFADWYKCGSRTRDTRFTRPLLYPSELTCGGMKQSGRAVRACATRSGAQARQVGFRTHIRCTIDVSTSSLNRGNPRSQILPSPSLKFLAAQNDETPVGSAFRGLGERLFRGLPSGQPRNFCE